MSSRIFFAVFYIAFFILISHARSTASIYSWQDADGVTTFTDDLSKAPSDVKVKVLSEETRPQTVAARSTETASSPAPKQPSRVATEGEFVVQLVEELGLSNEPTEEEAAGILSDIRIAPRLGRWELGRPMTDDLTVRLRTLAVAAAESGRIALSEDEVLLAFDTTAALLGLTIPVTIEPEDASQEPLPLAETPPLVYVAPPPAVIYPYYAWVPVAGGFWWNGSLCSGFFVLDVNSFSKHRGFRGHRGVWDSGRIGRQFRNHIADRHFVKNPAFSNRGRDHRLPGHSGQTPVSNRFSNHSIRPNMGASGVPMDARGMRSSGSRVFGIPPERRHITQRPMPSSSFRSFNRNPARPQGRQFTASMSPPHATRPAPSRSFSNRQGSVGASIGQGFGTGGAGMGINRGGSGFSAGFRSSRGR